MNTQVKFAPQSSTIEDKVDRFVDLTNQLAFCDALIKERDSLRKQLAEYADTLSNDAVKLSGHSAYVSLTKPPVMREITDINSYFEAVTFEGFLSSVKVSTTAADKLLSETQKAKLFETSLGSRRIKDTGEILQATKPRQGVKLFDYLAGLNTQAR